MPEAVEIICIIDRSGSMESLKSDAIGSFNTFIEEQKKVPGDAVVTAVLFNDEYKALYERKPLLEVPPMTAETYRPMGCTALLQAICRTLETPGKAEKGIVVILTDGLENASEAAFTKDRAASAVKALESKGWQVHYLAANQNAFTEGAALGITHTMTYQPTSAGVKDAYSTACFAATSYRTGSGLPKGFDVNTTTGRDTKKK